MPAVLCLIAFLFPSSARALDVEQIQWGYDGQVVANRFNLLSVLVSNPSPQPFDGRVQLQKSNGVQQVDAPLTETLYLAPHSSRWVQFFPYTKLDSEEWSLSWRPASPGEYALTKPGKGPPACILLEEPNSLSTTGGALKRFPDNLFPAYLTATDGLASVVLDHVPRWEEGRQRAFIAWVRHGGRVHLIHTAQGEYPQFTGLLRALNTTRAIERVGNGYVHRHPLKRKEIDKPYVDTVIAPGRDPAVVAAEMAATSGRAARKTDTNDPEDQRIFSFEWEGDAPLLTALKKMTRPDHRWLVIHLLSLAYLLLIFPGCYLIGKRFSGDYRIVFGVLLTLVALFSLAFLVVGRRGYNEHAAVDAVAIARVAEGERYDVTQWSNAFVTAGGDYTFAHQGVGRIYSTCQDEEFVRHRIENGAEACLIADMPPYSSRSFGHRALVPAPVVSATIAQWETVVELRQETMTLRDMSVSTTPPLPERVLQRLTLVKGPQFPREYREINVLYGRRLYSLSENADRLELKSEIGTLTTFLKLDRQFQFGNYLDPFSEQSQTPQNLFAGLFEPLVARSVNITSQRDAQKFALPDDRVRLLVYAPMPREMFVNNQKLGTQRGWVLYCLDVFPPES